MMTYLEKRQTELTVLRSTLAKIENMYYWVKADGEERWHNSDAVLHEGKMAAFNEVISILTDGIKETELEIGDEDGRLNGF